MLVTRAHLILRLGKFAGLRDEAGLSYTPSVVRVGLNAHHSVSAVTMDTLVSLALLCLFDSRHHQVALQEAGLLNWVSKSDCLVSNFSKCFDSGSSLGVEA